VLQEGYKRKYSVGVGWLVKEVFSWSELKLESDRVTGAMLRRSL
jgi:hypothetical protein